MASRELVRLLNAEMATRQAVDRLLADAASSAEDAIRALGRNQSVGATVQRAQLRGVLAEVRAQQTTLWEGVRTETTRGVGRAQVAAMQGVEDLASVATRAGVSIPRSSYTARSSAVVRAAIARETLSRQELSATVYKHRALSMGYVETALRRGMGRGATVRAIAKDVQRFISPSTPGGSAYAARRLARTEVANAYHAGSRAGYKDNPFVEKVDWRISGSHPKPDDCDDLADQGPYRPHEVPDKPHPNCLCSLVPVTVSEEDFIRAFNRGSYDEWLDQSGAA